MITFLFWSFVIPCSYIIIGAILCGCVEAVEHDDVRNISHDDVIWTVLIWPAVVVGLIVIVSFTLFKAFLLKVKKENDENLQRSNNETES
jgi:uncharacterized integral membrane protein